MASWFRRTSSADPLNTAAAQGQPLLLIGFNEATHKWEVGREALDVLRTISGPMCTVAVCGRARQGKSFLLNQMLSKFSGVDKPKGFVVSPTHQSCTRGIWMWSAPIQISGPDGRKCNAILMDCEGVDAVDQGQQHSAQIFSMAMLMSSIFIYNQVGAIDAIAIERLAMVCELAKRIKDRSTAGGANGVAAAAGQVDFSPAFIWLLRDFQLKLEAGGKSISPAEYLEEALLPIKGTTADIANRNQMRQTIKAVFPDRDVCTLVRPALTEAELQKLDTLPSNKLRPEFLKDMDDLMAVIRSKARPMAVGGTLVSGTVLAGLSAAYVQAVNQGAVPQLVTAWQGVSRAECQKAYEKAIAAYNNTFKVTGILEETPLHDAHLAALSAAMDCFKSEAMGEPEMLGEFETKLRAELEERHKDARRKLAADGARLADQMLATETTKLQRIMTGKDASVEAVEAELRRFLDEYDLKVPSGPHKYKRAAEFLMNTIIIGIKGIVKDIITARDSAAARATAAEADVAQLRAEVSRLSEAESRASTSHQQLLEAQQEAARLAGQAESKQRHIVTLESELTQLRQQQSATEAAQHKVQQELQVAKAEVTRLQGQLEAAGRMRQELEGLRQQLADVGQREAALQQQKAAAEQEASSKAVQLSSAQATIDRLQGEANSGRSELTALRAQLTEMAKQLEEAQAAAANVQVEDSRVRGELEEERKKVTAKMQEVAALTAELAKEREEHDTTRAKLKAARPNLQSPPAGGASPAPAATAGGRATKRRRTELPEEDQQMQDVDEAQPAETPAATPAAAPATAAAAAAAGTVNTDIQPQKMTVNELKQWVTDNCVDDDEFYKLAQASKTKKADWVAYVKKKLAAVQS